MVLRQRLAAPQRRRCCLHLVRASPAWMSWLSTAARIQGAYLQPAETAASWLQPLWPQQQQGQPCHRPRHPPGRERSRRHWMLLGCEHCFAIYAQRLLCKLLFAPFYISTRITWAINLACGPSLECALLGFLDCWVVPPPPMAAGTREAPSLDRANGDGPRRPLKALLLAHRLFDTPLKCCTPLHVSRRCCCYTCHRL